MRDIALCNKQFLTQYKYADVDNFAWRKITLNLAIYIIYRFLHD